MSTRWGLTLALALTTSCGNDDEPANNDGSGDAADTAAADGTNGNGGSQDGPGGDDDDDDDDDRPDSGPDDDDDDSGPGDDDDDDDTQPSTESVRFLAFGDSGEGNEAQFATASAAEGVCEERGCDFALLLGDNFYDVGVTSVDDPQFADKFEMPYAGLDMPFYVILGNHDYGDFIPDWNRGQYQIDYADVNDKWTMPDFWYTFTSESGQTQFFALDTMRVMFNHELSEQRTWLETELAASTSPWKVAFGHHPYISNGQHGNAGNYEGIGGLPVIAGDYVKELVEDYLCGQVHAYINGHDHNRQSFDPVCGTYFFVSGAAAKTTDFAFHDDNPTTWGDDTREGFLWAEIEGETMTVAHYDLDGNLDHETIISQ